MSTAVTHDIVETIRSSGSLGTLARAIQASGMADTLRTQGPITIFAPTDEAFEQIAATLSGAMKDKEKLCSILKHHMVSGKYTSGEVVRMESLATLEGSLLRISTADGCTINGARICQADIQCTNGVIHMVENVLMPQ